MCLSHSIVLLEEPTSHILHMVQIKFKRNPSWNQEIASFYNFLFPLICNDTNYNNPTYNTFSNSKTYVQYSFKFDPISIFSKAFLNYGFDMYTNPPLPLPENNSTNNQQLSFYFTGVTSDGKISFETNNLNLRCKPVLSNSFLDLTLDDTIPIKNVSWNNIHQSNPSILKA
jgi:hypothetical protein